MTPLEAMCRAMRDSEPGMEKKDWRYWLPSARAALVALAECELSPDVTIAGRAAGYEAVEAYGLQNESWHIKAMFSAICRSIATEGKENG